MIPPGWGRNNMRLKDDDAIQISESVISTIISGDTVIEGNLISSGSVRFGGLVKGDITAKGLVIVTKGAEVRGNITAESILVAGRVKGNLNSSDKTNIEATGEVYGDIAARRLLVDEESVFSGKCNMMPEEDGKDEISYIDIDELRGTGGIKQKGGRRRKQK